MTKIIWGLRDHVAYRFKGAVSFGKRDVCQGKKNLENKNLLEANLSVSI